MNYSASTPLAVLMWMGLAGPGPGPSKSIGILFIDLGTRKLKTPTIFTKKNKTQKSVFGLN
jgi:hypothetical protein